MKIETLGKMNTEASAASAPFSTSVKVSVSTDPASFADIWPTMSGLDGKFAYVFQSLDLLEVWLRTIGKARRTHPLFIRVDDINGEPILLIPLGIERRFGVRILSFLDGGVSDYNAPVLFPSASIIDAQLMKHIWNRICALLPPFDIGVLEKMPVTVLGMNNPFRFLVSETSLPSGHLILLNGKWEDFAASRLPRRQDSRRKRRRLGELGPIRFLIARDSAEIERIFATMLRQKTRRYIETRGISGFRPGYQTYFREIVDSFIPQGSIQLSALLVDEKIVATHLGFVAAKRFYFFIPTFEVGEFAKFSPGRLLIEDLIAWSYSQGIKVFDFGSGDEIYKEEFRDSILPLTHLRTPKTIIGFICVELFALRQSLSAGPIGRGLKAVRRQGGRLKQRLIPAHRSSDLSRSG